MGFTPKPFLRYVEFCTVGTAKTMPFSLNGNLSDVGCGRRAVLNNAEFVIRNAELCAVDGKLFLMGL